LAIAAAPQGRSRPPYLILAVLALIGAAAIGVLWYLAPGPQNGKPVVASYGKAAIGGPFRLTDDTGRTVTNRSYAGKYMLVYFGYTYCPDICPTELQIMSRAIAMLGPDAKRVQPLFITIDPARDTVKEMADYMSHFSPAPMGLTGTPEQIASVAKAYRVYYKKVPGHSAKGDDYQMNHSSLIYFMGPDGAYIDNFPPGTTPGDMAKHVREIVRSGAQ